MLTPHEDAYGRVIENHHRGLNSSEFIERDDGWVGASGGGADYFAPFEDWPQHERRSIRLARGRVLDIGCGAGRVALLLQERGLEVVATDSSPLAIKISRLRGVEDARVVPITRISKRTGIFDTVILFGNNFGLVGNPRRAKWLLRRLWSMTSESGRILATSRKPDPQGDADHRRYYQANRKRGLLPGRTRIRVRSGTACTPWFDHLNVAPHELRALARDTGWKLTRCFESRSPHYAAILEKTSR